ncbi:hypothetical protein SAMN05421868_110143 [Paenibacillus naphthalenovorans]|nr:hypothetical protein SAMN05421868_110143 [Paenibacillus naphthalenovorans]
MKYGGAAAAKKMRIKIFGLDIILLTVTREVWFRWAI